MSRIGRTLKGSLELSPPLKKEELARHIRRHLALHVVDDSGLVAQGSAIYSLSDPRDVRDIRYIGQTSSPRRRYLQHLSTARLWLPDELPWWVKSPRLRPLYEWIREIHRDQHRLPVMVISAWVETDAARMAERERIIECLQRRARLLNVETESLGRQLVLI